MAVRQQFTKQQATTSEASRCYEKKHGCPTAHALARQPASMSEMCAATCFVAGTRARALLIVGERADHTQAQPAADFSLGFRRHTLADACARVRPAASTHKHTHERAARLVPSSPGGQHQQGYKHTTQPPARGGHLGWLKEGIAAGQHVTSKPATHGKSGLQDSTCDQLRAHRTAAGRSAPVVNELSRQLGA